MLEGIKRDVLAGRPVGGLWELVRLVVYAEREDEDARAALKEWARANGIKVRFEPRQVEAGGKAQWVDYVVFTAN
jgi:hypothetical protein